MVSSFQTGLNSRRHGLSRAPGPIKRGLLGRPAKAHGDNTLRPKALKWWSKAKTSRSNSWASTALVEFVSESS